MTKQPRVPLVESREDLPEAQREHYDAIAESRGGVRGPFAVLLHSPELAGRVGHLGAYVRFESGLSDADRELAILTTAREFDCAYEWAAHAPIAREAGVREAAIEAVAKEAPAADLRPEEATIVSLVRELLGEHEISGETFDAAAERFDERGLTELVATAGYYSMIACALNAFEVLPDDDAPTLP